MSDTDLGLMLADETIGSSWSKDEKAAAASLTADEARVLVDYYSTVQGYRIRSANQVRASAESGEPNACLGKLLTSVKSLEHKIQLALGLYVKAHLMGPWMNAVVGIGPVIAAGMAAHIDITRCPNTANLWSFAGLNPSASWLGKEGAAKLYAECAQETGGDIEETFLAMCSRARRNPTSLRHMLEDEDTGETRLTKTALINTFALRPWNSKLKVLCWKAGQSFVKTSGNPKSFYGRIYAERKCYELERNAEGAYRDQALEILVNKKIGKETEAYKAYSIGKLPPAHLQARSERYAVKMFLSHLHTVWRFRETGSVPPLPYVLEHVTGHHDLLLPPHLEVIPGLLEAITTAWQPSV